MSYSPRSEMWVCWAWLSHKQPYAFWKASNNRATSYFWSGRNCTLGHLQRRIAVKLQGAQCFVFVFVLCLDSLLNHLEILSSIFFEFSVPCLLETGSHWQTFFVLSAILLPLPSNFWDYRYVPPPEAKSDGLEAYDSDDKRQERHMGPVSFIVSCTEVSLVLLSTKFQQIHMCGGSVRQVEEGVGSFTDEAWVKKEGGWLLTVLRGKDFVFVWFCFLDILFTYVSVLTAGFKREAECASNGHQPHHMLPHWYGFLISVNLVFLKSILIHSGDKGRCDFNTG